MSESDPLPPDDTYAIHCQPSKMVDGVAQPTLFQPRVDDYLSGAWLENTEFPTQLEQIREICRQMVESKFRKVRASHKLALLSVSNALGNVRENLNFELEFVHHPIPDYESHAGIHGIEQDPNSISVELSETCSMAPVILN